MVAKESYTNVLPDRLVPYRRVVRFHEARSRTCCICSVDASTLSHNRGSVSRDHGFVNEGTKTATSAAMENNRETI